MENKMRMRNKYKKPTSLNCYAGNRYRLPLVVCSFIGCIVMFHFHILKQSQHGQHALMQMNSEHPFYRELVTVEDDIKIPPPRKRSPRAIKRKPKRPTTLIEEFLDESSQLKSLRYILFPGQKTVIDPIKDAGNEIFYYHPGRIWLDAYLSSWGRYSL